jgi:Large polyvalent protein-associated domain 7
MADDLEGKAGSGRGRAPKPTTPEPASTKPRRKAETPTLTDDLTGKFLRVGVKLYRTSDDNKPIARLEPDRLRTSNIDALPDLLRIAKANGWTSLRVNGGDTFRRAAFLAAAGQGLTVENYTPSKVVQAEADRLQARRADREQRREAKRASGKSAPADALNGPQALADRFLSQTHEQNAGDPDLRHAQSLVAQTIAVARAKHPDDPLKAAKEIEARRQAVARRIASGDQIASVQIRTQQAQRVREIMQDQSVSREGRTR